MLKLGSQDISAAYLGGAKIKKGYLGESVVFDVSEPPVPAYTITASIDPAGSGTVTGTGAYQEGETVTVAAAPEEGYQFTAWQEHGAVVSEDEVYTFAVTGDRTLTAVFEAVQTGRLPVGYTEVEYIKTGTACSINSNLTVYPSKTRLVLDADISATVNANEQVFYAGNVSGSTITLFSLSRKSKAQVIAGSNAASSKTISVDISGRHTIDYDGTADAMTVDATKYAFYAASSGSAGKLCIGRGSTITSYTSADMNVYSVKVYTSGALVRDFVPCKDPSGNIGLYDLVGAAFYGGGGAAGPVV